MAGSPTVKRVVSNKDGNSLVTECPFCNCPL